MSDNQDWITVRGARTHNLKNIDVKLPRVNSLLYLEFRVLVNLALLLTLSMPKGKEGMLRAFHHTQDNLSAK